MPEFRAGRVEWDEEALERDRAKMKAPLTAAGGLGALGAAARAPAVAANLAKQGAIARALRERVKDPVDRYFGK